MNESTARIDPDIIRQASASPKQTPSMQSTDPRRWSGLGLSVSMPSNPIPILLITHLPMYVVVTLVGFTKFTGFYLEVSVLAALIGVAAAFAFPYSISIAVTTIRKSVSE